MCPNCVVLIVLILEMDRLDYDLSEESARYEACSVIKMTDITKYCQLAGSRHTGTSAITLH